LSKVPWLTGREKPSWAAAFVLPLLVTASLMAGTASPAAASPGALRVLILESQCDPSEPAETLRGQILAQPGVAAVDFFNGSVATPTAAQLSPYDVVLAMGDCSWIDAAAVGNSLADYQDQGGVVVGATFDWEGTGGYVLAGRWISAGYSPYETGAATEFGTATLGAHDSSSPLLSGVASLSAFYRNDPVLSVGATEVARWSDGTSAVAVKGNAVAINAYIGNDNGSSFSGDFAKIIVNAANVLGKHYLSVAKAGSGQGTVTSTPAGINCGALCSATFNNGVLVTLTATPASGSSFSGWSGAGCSGTATCAVAMSAAQSVTATFAAIPPHCVVPNVTGKKLKAAKKKIRAAHCKVGHVGKKKGVTVKSGKVVKQSPKRGKVLRAGSKVNVKLG
jgi:hypothetical protein